MAKVVENIKNTKPSDDMDAIRKDIESLRGNIEDLTRHMKNEGAARMENVKDRVNDTISSYKETGMEKLESVERQVKEKPAQSMAIAFAAGMFASFLFGRR